MAGNKADKQDTVTIRHGPTSSAGRPGGRLQLADIIVEREVATAAKQKIELWTG